MYKAIDIAKYVIHYCTLKGSPISDIQLQKILYYIQLNFYRLLDRPAFVDRIEAWQYGPVVPSVYNMYNNYGARKICLYDFSAEEKFSNKELDIIKRVINMCIRISPWELVRKSHKVGGPWQEIYQGANEIIPEELIRKYAKKGN